MNEPTPAKKTIVSSSKTNLNEEFLFELKATKLPKKMIRCGRPKGHMSTAVEVKRKKQTFGVPVKYSLKSDYEKKKLIFEWIGLSYESTIKYTTSHLPTEPKLIKSEFF